MTEESFDLFDTIQDLDDELCEAKARISDLNRENSLLKEAMKGATVIANQSGARIIVLEAELAEKDVTIATLREALRPFASYAASPSANVPGELVVTAGSNMAKRQLTMQNCYDASTALSTIDASKER
jgi:hypothetical protein